MEQRIEQLFKRLNFLGYCAFETQSIIQEATGNDKERNVIPCIETINVLEKYEKLGTNYLLAYSK
jgi:hypothetical protein